MLVTLLVCVWLGGVQGFLFNREKCYGKYGCFSGSKPYNNARGFLPESPDSQGIQFLLYTRSNQGSAQILKEDDSHSVQQSHFNPHHSSKLIIHGYTDSGHAQWIINMKQEILKYSVKSSDFECTPEMSEDFTRKVRRYYTRQTSENANVIAVNWQKGAAKTNYLQAAANTRVVGAVIAELIKTLHSAGASYNNFHLIGHSLGSHISGYAGEIIHGLGRITGLDPAGPSFETYDPKTRLDQTDANFVDAIHTDAESLAKLGLGMMKAVGDADFYPNGGFNQPGCPANTGNHLFSLLTGGLVKLKNGAACSHNRVLDMFTSSINNHCHYTAYPCTESTYKAGHCTSCGGRGCSNMGYHASTSEHGSFYLTTGAHGPYYCCEWELHCG